MLAPPNYLAPLGVMRSLRRLGVPVYALSTSSASLWMFSRFCAGLVSAGLNGSPDGHEPEATLGQLQRAGQALGGDVVLIPGSDEWALFVAQHAQELRHTFRFPDLSYELARRLCNKQLVFSLAT